MYTVLSCDRGRRVVRFINRVEAHSLGWKGTNILLETKFDASIIPEQNDVPPITHMWHCFCQQVSGVRPRHAVDYS